MYSHTCADPSYMVRLVDLGESAVNYSGRGELIDGTFERNLISIANNIISIEGTLGKQLSSSRSALEIAIDFAAENIHDLNLGAPTFINAARFVISEMVAIDPDDDEDFYDRFSL